MALRRPIAAALVLMLACLGCGCNAQSLSDDYASHETFPTLGATVFWTVDDTHLHLAIEATTEGWVGFGIAEPLGGSMRGADVVTAAVLDSGEVRVDDRFAVANALPERDCSQDWVPVGGAQAGGVTTVRLRRLLTTGDGAQDRPLIRDPDGQPVRVILAVGASDDVSYHGGDKRLATALALFPGTTADPLAALRDDPNIIQLVLTPSSSVASAMFGSADLKDGEGFAIPAAKTTYVDACFDVGARLEADHGMAADELPWHVVAVEPILSAATHPFVHHFGAYLTNQRTAGCVSSIIPGPLFYGWAAGTGPLVLPPEAGFPIGGNGGMQQVNVNIHYDNPGFTSGMIDNSGIRLFISRARRPHDAAMLTVGDPFVMLVGQSIPSGGPVGVEISCPGNCTSKMDGAINVFATWQHMHQVGAAMETTVTRDGAPSPALALTTEYYGFEFQLTSMTRYEIQRGDDVRVRCTYRVPDGAGTVRMGLASDDEMCQSFLAYYPADPYMQGTNSGRCGLGFCGAVTESLGLKSDGWRGAVAEWPGECGAAGPHAEAPAPTSGGADDDDDNGDETAPSPGPEALTVSTSGGAGWPGRGAGARRLVAAVAAAAAAAAAAGAGVV